MASVQREQVISPLRGQSITLCDLNIFFRGWRKEVNPNLARLREDMDRWLDKSDNSIPVSFSGVHIIAQRVLLANRTMAQSPSLATLKAANFCLFSAS